MPGRDVPSEPEIDPSSPSAVEPEPAAARAIFGDRLDLARRYVASLATDGVVRGLIGPREASRLWSRHVLNSAVVAPLIPDGARVVDVGTGAGLPGIPLAIARPDLRIDLVEPLERRTRFLSDVVAALELSRCRVVRGRAQDVIEVVGGADVVTSRAVAPLGKLVGWSAPLARPGGTLLALKGSSAGEEIERDADELRRMGVTDVSVRTVGDGLVDPVTYVVQATVTDRVPGRRGAARRPTGRRPRAGR
jgi:16S rRNA (guanine527-N7)-methyltransferase